MTTASEVYAGDSGPWIVGPDPAELIDLSNILLRR
jgi:hypothetical protein